VTSRAGRREGRRRALVALAGAIVGFLVAAGGIALTAGRVRIEPERQWWIRCVLAFGAGALSLVQALRGRGADPPRRAERMALVALGLLGALAYFGFGAAQPPWGYHRSEMIHHALGSKYAAELGYTRLYDCLIRAQAQLGARSTVEGWPVRDLRTNLVGTGAEALRRSDECAARFTPARWSAFVDDVRLMRAAIPEPLFRFSVVDHGYNAPPAWTLWARTLTARLALDDGAMRALALCDLALLAATFAALWWGFGLRVLCVGLVFWGCQFPASNIWTIGAFLRQDWLFFLVLATAAARRRRHGLAGAAWAFASLLRLFPVVAGLGVAALAGAAWWRRRRVPRALRRFARGALVVAMLGSTASAALLGAGSYREYAAHLRVYQGTLLTNRMGLRTALTHVAAGPAFDEEVGSPVGGHWQAAREERYARRALLYYALVAAALVAYALVAARLGSVWMAIALVAAALPIAVDLLCYYYAFFLLVAAASRTRPELESMLLLVAGASPILVGALGPGMPLDAQYTRESILFIALGVALLVAAWPWSGVPRGTARPPERAA
jgi:hypothetical protein